MIKMNMKTKASFETKRLFLRPTSEEDAPFIFELMNSPKWIKYIGDRHIVTIEDAKTYIIDKMKPQQERLGFSNYTILRRSDKMKLGTCGLYDREGLEGIDIGFAFLSKFEKMGYAFEAATRLKIAAFEEFDIQVIKAITTKNNIASQKLLEKLGLSQVGTKILPNDAEELLVYAIDKTDAD